MQLLCNKNNLFDMYRDNKACEMCEAAFLAQQQAKQQQLCLLGVFTNSARLLSSYRNGRLTITSERLKSDCAEFLNE